MCSFVRGFINDEEEDREEFMDEDESKAIMEPHGEDFANCISELLQVSLEKQYQPLQKETLALLSNLSTVLTEKFAEHYGKFMPGLKTVMHNTPMETDS